MVRVRPVIDVPAAAFGDEDLVVRQVVELNAHAVGRNLEFRGQFPKVCLGSRIEEQFHEEC